ncbi:MAG: DNA-protecting protein DprA [Gemmatimonadetes bacterium]|nr:DNA-protecting protein DprA [Gemmatimonadota bacterium]
MRHRRRSTARTRPTTPTRIPLTPPTTLSTPDERAARAAPDERAAGAAPDERVAALAIAGIAGLGPVRITRLVADAGDVASALSRAVPDARERDALLARARTELADFARRGIDVVGIAESRYPAPVRDLEDAPPVLYALGALAHTVPPAVALVGSRQATAYGRQVARDFARRLASRGICVVSGLAAGIDAESHAAALSAGGPTVAVQGTGVDVAYPRSNTALHARIAREGLVLSELAPGRPAHAGAFPRRNRIIAALADVVVVVEAGVRSGALITAQLGGELGRTVAAVPGPIDAEASRGANQLLRDGAQVIASFDDLLGLLALTRRGHEGAAFATPTAVDDDVACRLPPDVQPDSAEGRVLAVLARGAQGTDDLVRACALSPRDVATALCHLEVHGEIAFDPSGMVRIVSRTAMAGR